MGDAHALAAAAGRRLDHHGVADPVGDDRRLVRVEDHAEMAGDGRDAGRRRELLRFDLVAHRRDRPRVRPDEGDAGGGERLGEGGALGEEAVAGMDRLGAGTPAGVDDLVDDEVGGGCRRRPDMDRLVGHLGVERVAIDVAIDGDRLDAEAAGGPGDANGDLAPVGDQDLLEHGPSALQAGLCKAGLGEGQPEDARSRGGGMARRLAASGDEANGEVVVGQVGVVVERRDEDLASRPVAVGVVVEAAGVPVVDEAVVGVVGRGAGVEHVLHLHRRFGGESVRGEQKRVCPGLEVA